MAEFASFRPPEQPSRAPQLEPTMPSSNGLNLTWECWRACQANGPLGRPGAGVKPSPALCLRTIAAYSTEADLELAGWPSAEAQVAAIDDDIAYTITTYRLTASGPGLFAIADPRAAAVVARFSAMVISGSWVSIRPCCSTRRAPLIDLMVTDVLDLAPPIRRVRDRHPDQVRAPGKPCGLFRRQFGRTIGPKTIPVSVVYRPTMSTRMTGKARLWCGAFQSSSFAQPYRCDRVAVHGQGRLGTAATAALADYIAE